MAGLSDYTNMGMEDDAPSMDSGLESLASGTSRGLDSFYGAQGSRQEYNPLGQLTSGEYANNPNSPEARRINQAMAMQPWDPTSNKEDVAALQAVSKMISLMPSYANMPPQAMALQYDRMSKQLMQTFPKLQRYQDVIDLRDPAHIAQAWELAKLPPDQIMSQVHQMFTNIDRPPSETREYKKSDDDRWLEHVAMLEGQSTGSSNMPELLQKHAGEWKSFMQSIHPGLKFDKESYEVDKMKMAAENKPAGVSDGDSARQAFIKNLDPANLEYTANKYGLTKDQVVDKLLGAAGGASPAVNRQPQQQSHGYDMESVMYTAKKYNMTPEQVIAKLKGGR